MITSNLERLLQERDWSGRELSRRSGLHRDTISAWRRRCPERFERAMIERLLKTLDCTLTELLTDTTAEASPPPQPMAARITKQQSIDARIAELERQLQLGFQRGVV